MNDNKGEQCVLIYFFFVLAETGKLKGLIRNVNKLLKIFRLYFEIRRW